MSHKALMMLAILLVACGQAPGGGGGSFGGGGNIGQPAGKPCSPSYQKQGCFQNDKMECDAATSLWKLLAPCGAETCKQKDDPSGGGFKLAVCEPNTSAATDASGGDGGTTGGDAAMAFPDGTQVQADGTVRMPDGQVVGFDAVGDATVTPPDAQVVEAVPVEVLQPDTTKPDLASPDVPDTLPDGGPLFDCAQKKCPSQVAACLQSSACYSKAMCAAGCNSNTDCIVSCAGSGPGASEFMAVLQCALTQGCTSPTPKCGDGVCQEPQESATSCPKDCGTAPTGPGCTSAKDQQYLANLPGDPLELNKFGQASKTCTLGGCFPKSSDTEGAACIGKCLVSQGIPLSENCATCYGAFSYCSAKNCLANCAANPTGLDCAKCQADKGCTAAKDACIAGKTPPPVPVCGNGKCEPGENSTSCAKDCGLPAVCGNGTCEPSESPSSCPKDCGSGTAQCLNGKCEPGETVKTCVWDCDPLAKCLMANCDSETKLCFGEQKCVDMYACVAKCKGNQTCAQSCVAKDAATAQKLNGMLTCWNDSGCDNMPTCGDGKCGTGETSAACPEDCGAG